MTRTTLAAALAASFAVSGAASAQELFEMTSGYANNLPILGRRLFVKLIAVKIPKLANAAMGWVL